MAASHDSRAQPVRQRFAIQMQRTLPPASLLDRVYLLIGAFNALWLSIVVLTQGFRTWWGPLLIVPVWAIIAYLALPRLHRMLSDLYVPDYFFGRTRTADGLLGDPVNLGVDGDFAQLDHVMLEAGWTRADEITLQSTWRIITSTLFRRSFPTAPVSPLFLFRRRHDVAYQQEVDGDPKQRHHVRFWHCPPDWLLPGGAHVDWLGAATYDTNVGLNLFTLQVTHRIDANTDVERDFVVDGVIAADPAARVHVLHDLTTGYHSRNGGGDRFITDGDLPILDVTRVPTPHHAPEVIPAKTDAAHAAAAEVRTAVERAPVNVVLGFLAVLAGVVYEIFGLAEAIAELTAGESLFDEPVVALAAGLSAALVIAQLVLASAVLHGGARRSRYLLLFALMITIVVTAIQYVSSETSIAFDWTLLGATVHSMALISLSGESAANWSRPKGAHDHEDALVHDHTHELALEREQELERGQRADEDDADAADATDATDGVDDADADGAGTPSAGDTAADTPGDDRAHARLHAHSQGPTPEPRRTAEPRRTEEPRDTAEPGQPGADTTPTPDAAADDRPRA